MSTQLLKTRMYRTTLTTMHLYHPGHACMHRPLLAFDSAVHSCYVRVETVQSVWVFGHCAWVRMWSGGYEGQQPRADISPPRFRARCQGSKGNVCVGTLTCAPHISAQCPLISWGICSGLGQWQQALSQAQKYHQGNRAA